MVENIDYDFTEGYKHLLEPMVDRIRQICYENDIPFSFEFAIKNSAGSTEYAQEALLPMQKEMRLYDDKLSDISKVMVGYAPHKDVITLPDIDDSDTL